MGDATHHQSLSLITMHAAMTVNRSQWRLTGCAKQNIPGPTATCRRNRQRTRGFSEACETSWRTAYGQLRSSEKRWPAESTVHTCLNSKLPSLGFAFANHNFLLLVPTLSSLFTIVHAACRPPFSLAPASDLCVQKLRYPHTIATPAVHHRMVDQ